jgi:hypothetical protein
VWGFLREHDARKGEMMNEVNKLLEAIVGVVGAFIGWIISSVDNNPAIAKVAFSTAGLAALFIAVYAAMKIAMWMFAKITSTIRSVRHRTIRLSRWMGRNRVLRSLKGKFMAKWKTSVMADDFEELIFKRQMEGFLSDQEANRLRKKMGKALGLLDIMPRSIGKKLRWHFKGGVVGKDIIPATYQKLAGPVKPIPGGKPGEDVKVADANVVRSATLDRLREKRAKVA